MSVIVRDANPDDLREIVDIEEEVSLEKYPNAEAGITEDDIGRIGFGLYRVRKYQHRFFDDPGAHVWAVEINGRVVGFAAATKSSEHRLNKLYVLPAHQKEGVGSKLLQAALEWLGRGKEVVLGAAEYDHEAIDFYKAHGFVDDGLWPGEQTVLPTGKTLRQVRLVKRPE